MWSLLFSAGPVSILATISMGFLLGISFLLSVTFSIQDPANVLSPDNAVGGGNPVMGIAWDAFAARWVLAWRFVCYRKVMLGKGLMQQCCICCCSAELCAVVAT
jgi:hypothetical protein